jgi:tryptophan-rich sensory protein
MSSRTASQSATATPLIPAGSVKSAIFMLVALLMVAAASGLGSSATAPSIPVWYEGLNKPWFNPPNIAFPIAWSALFLLMAFSFWRILRQVDGGEPRKTAILVFIIQLLFNVAWSFAFFGAQSPLTGVFVAAGLVLAVAGMVLAFRKIDRLAGNLQLPYLAWVSFALVLNIAIWRLN